MKKTYQEEAIKKPTAKELAKKFVTKASEYGMAYDVKRSVVTVSRTITIGDNEDFTKAETEASILLHDICPHQGGSVWGTDGGSIGGMVAVQSGFFKMNKSGSGGVAFARAVAEFIR